MLFSSICNINMNQLPNTATSQRWNILITAMHRLVWLWRNVFIHALHSHTRTTLYRAACEHTKLIASWHAESVTNRFSLFLSTVREMTDSWFIPQIHIYTRIFTNNIILYSICDVNVAVCCTAATTNATRCQWIVYMKSNWHTIYYIYSHFLRYFLSISIRHSNMTSPRSS